MGFYIDITKIEAPNSAEQGSPVSVKVTAKNKATTIGQYILVMGRYDTTDIYASPEYAWVEPQKSQIFTISFTMPPRNIVLGIWGFIWVEYEPGYWYQDTYNEVSITIKTIAWIPLASRSVIVSVTPTAWVALASTSITLKRIITAWVVLAQVNQLVKVSIAVMWVALAQVTVPIKTIPHNWIFLSESSASIKALPPIKEEYAWLPWVAGIGAIGLAAYAVTRKD